MPGKLNSLTPFRIDDRLMLTEQTEINLNTSPNRYNTVISVTSAEGIALYADTLPIPTLDAVRNGWKYTKVTGVEKMNLHMFGHIALNPLLVNDLQGFWAVVSMDTLTNVNSLPFFVVNTLPVSAGGTGTGGDASWYKSKRTFHINLDNTRVYNGEQVLIYFGPDPNINRHIRHIQCTTTTTDGDYFNDETIWLISLHTESGAPNGNQVITHSMGWAGGVYNTVAKININLV